MLHMTGLLAQFDRKLGELVKEPELLLGLG